MSFSSLRALNCICGDNKAIKGKIFDLNCALTFSEIFNILLISLLTFLRSKTLEDYIATLENNIAVKNTDVATLESTISQLNVEKAQLGAEMNAVNQVNIIAS